MTQIKYVQLGKWSMQTSTNILTFGENEIIQLSILASKWRNVFFAGGNYMERTFNAPSLVIRVDYSLSDSGHVQAYEVEERPAGLGVLSLMNPDAYSAVASEFNLLGAGILVSKKREILGSDDFFQDKIPVWREGEIQKAGLLYTRVHRDEEQFYKLLSKSVSTIQLEGSKGYGVRLGMWQRLPDGVRDNEWFERLFSKSFALKNYAGSRFDGVCLWTTDKRRGCDTKSKIRKTIESGLGVYIQPYASHEARHTFLPDGYTLFRRTFLVFDTAKLEYKVVGGVYVAVPDIRGHGTSASITGPLMI